MVEREETVPPGYTSKRNYFWVITKIGALSFIVLLIIKVTILGYIINKVFDGDIDQFIVDMRA